MKTTLNLKQIFFIIGYLSCCLNITAQTNLIINPSFETGDYTGWTWTGRTGGWMDVNADGDTTKDGNYIAGYWNNNIGDVECYQEISVPNGKYKVTALVTVHSARISNQRLFANNNSTLYAAENHPAYTQANLQILTDLGETYTFAGIAGSTAENGPFSTISVETNVTDGKLKFGFKSGGHGSALGFVFNYAGASYDVGFFKFDNFMLNDDPNYQVTINPQGLKFVKNGIATEISFYSPSIVRVQKYNMNENLTKNNLVVTLSPETVNVTSEETETLVTLRSNEATVTFNKTNYQVIFYDKDGSRTLHEKANAYELYPKKDGVFDSYLVKQIFTLENDEQIYGLGQLQTGDLSQRGKNYWMMVQGNTAVCIPYIHSAKGYALYWDNYSPTTFNDDANGMMFESVAGYGINYYYLGGSKESGDKAVAQMRKLSGKAPMIPLWSYGYFQSKERYQSADETMGVVKKYRDLGVPLDCIVQDWQYWGGNNQWNAMEFLNPQFSNYQQMIDSIHNMNAKIIISFWANFGPDTKQFSRLKDMNALIKSGNDIMTDTYPSNEGVAIYDTYNKDARDYIWDCVYNGLTSKGIDAYWMDSSEPDHYQGGADREKTFDYITGLGTTWRSLRNAYPLVHVGGIHDNHRAESRCNPKRVTILTRSAFAGQQRYGANTWSGDITASWETLAKQIPAALNFTICGIPNWNSDIGGFFNGEYSGAGEEAYNELYARWLQFGTFSTMMRSHGAGSDRAIYRFGERGTIYFDIIEKYINLRYALLPYIYSTGWDVYNADASFMRALPMAYPEDTNTHLNNRDFMFGQSILAAPVVEPGAANRSVYLPAGNDWIDFWTGEKQNGGGNVNKKVDIQTLPLYVKTGAIIPWGPKVQYSTEQRWDSLEVRIYPGANGTFTLYEDEFDNYNYEQGKYTQIPFSWNEATRELTIGNRQGSYDGMIQNRKFAIVLVDSQTGIGPEQSNRISKIIEYNGNSLTVKIDNNTAIFTPKNNENPIVDVYTIMGIKVRSKVERSQAVTGLSPGIYIVNRQKIIVK